MQISPLAPLLVEPSGENQLPPAQLRVSSPARPGHSQTMTGVSKQTPNPEACEVGFGVTFEFTAFLCSYRIFSCLPSSVTPGPEKKTGQEDVG